MIIPFKKVVVTGLSAAMILGSASSVFADPHHGHEKDKDVSIHGKNNIQLILNFDDVNSGDVSWAEKDIASLAAKRVFEGYEDGTFRPRQEITHIEAITAAVRLMGLRDKAESQAEMSTQLNFKDADLIAQKYPWAVGYVAVAAENDLFSENTVAVQPNKPSSRLWATTLLVKALKLDAQAQAEMNAHLPFQDADKIPAGSVGYVAVAVEKGLINGFDDNTFRPNEPVTRAQLAALLDRTGNQLPNQDGTVIGKVSAAVANNVLTVVQNGQTVQITLDPNAFIFRDGVKVAASALQVGDQVRVREYNNVGVFVEVLKPSDLQQTFTVDGLFNSMTLNANGQISKISVNQAVYSDSTQTVQTAVYDVSPTVVIIGDTTQLVANHPVELQGKGQTVTQIAVK